MPTKTITTEFKNSFSRYIIDSVKHDHVPYKWIGNPDEAEINSAVSPLIGLKNVDEIKETIEKQIQLSLGRDDATEATTTVEIKEDEIEAKKEEIQLSFERQKEDENIIGCHADVACQMEQEKIEHFHSTQELLSVLEASFENILPCQRIHDAVVDVPDNDLASTVSDELSQFIKFMEQRGDECSTSEKKEIESIVAEQIAKPEAQTESQAVNESHLQTVNESQSREVTSELSNELCTYDTVYDLKQDPHNPFLFHICSKSSESPSYILPFYMNISGGKSSSIFFQGQEIRSCFIPLRDFRVKRRKQILDDIEYFVKTPKKPDIPLKRCNKNSIQKNLPLQQSNKKKKSLRKLKDKAKKKHPPQTLPSQPPIKIENVVQHVVPSALNKNSVPEATSISIEEKTVSINEWLQISSQVQPDTNVDVSEFLQFANSLPILTDIEDDAFQLARYMDANSQTNKQTGTVVNTENRIPQFQYQSADEIPSNDEMNSTDPLKIHDCTQPLDLSMKQKTPMSTDTGFCNESFSMDVTPPYRPSPRHTIHAHIGGINRNVITSAWTNYNRNNGDANVENGDDENDQLPPVQSTSWDRPTSVQRNVESNKTSAMSSTAQPIEICYVADVTANEEIKDQCPNETNPLLMDWKTDNYSTDLDYEPSDEEDNDANKSAKDDVKFTDQFRQNVDSTQALETQSPVPKNNWEILAIEMPNDESDSRIKARALSSDTVNTKPASHHVNGTVSQFSDELGPHLPNDLMQTALEHEYELLQNQISYLFSGPCFEFMTGKNCADGCKANHNLPPQRLVYRKLLLFPDKTIISMYSRFIAKNRMSFVTYFPIVCKVFGIRKMKSSLLAGIKHCEHYEQIPFYMDIYHGLIRMDISKHDALSMIAAHTCKSRKACTIILNIIVREDPTFFIGMLKKFYVLANVGTHHMLAIMYHVIENPAPSLLHLFIDMFDKYSMSDISDVDSYKILLHHAKSLVNGDVELMRRLNSIASRDNKTELLKIC